MMSAADWAGAEVTREVRMISGSGCSTKHDHILKSSPDLLPKFPLRPDRDPHSHVNLSLNPYPDLNLEQRCVALTQYPAWQARTGNPGASSAAAQAAVAGPPRCVCGFTPVACITTTQRNRTPSRWVPNVSHLGLTLNQLQPGCWPTDAAFMYIHLAFRAEAPQSVLQQNSHG